MHNGKVFAHEYAGTSSISDHRISIIYADRKSVPKF